MRSRDCDRYSHPTARRQSRHDDPGLVVRFLDDGAFCGQYICVVTHHGIEGVAATGNIVRDLRTESVRFALNSPKLGDERRVQSGAVGGVNAVQGDTGLGGGNGDGGGGAVVQAGDAHRVVVAVVDELVAGVGDRVVVGVGDRRRPGVAISPTRDRHLEAAIAAGQAVLLQVERQRRIQSGAVGGVNCRPGRYRSWRR